MKIDLKEIIFEKELFELNIKICDILNDYGFFKSFIIFSKMLALLALTEKGDRDETFSEACKVFEKTYYYSYEYFKNNPEGIKRIFRNKKELSEEDLKKPKEKEKEDIKKTKTELEEKIEEAIKN